MLILVLRPHARLPTIWQDSPHSFYAFLDEGVFRVTHDDPDPSSFLDLADHLSKHTWILFDSNLNNVAPNTATMDLFIVQAASPRSENFTWPGKKSVGMWYMTPFTQQELLMAYVMFPCIAFSFWYKR